ncbi:hypothetical protein AABB24_010936 [Solanum stoloniferum]|uniref:Uncharacterized protein n=1 Tax=Solanum stoloniferum TaxID=62892 RepID=A0ABD2UDQ9_9SOLN
MGLHLLIILKLNLRASSLSLNTPLIISLLCPFIIRLAACSFKPLHQIHYNLVYSMRLFFFQMSQITFNSQPPAAPTRWERAVRLVYERFTRARHTQFQEMDEESLRTLSMIAL